MRKAYLYRLYPSRPQADDLANLLDIGRAFYNAALQERRDAWRMQHISLNYYDQANQLKEIRELIPQYAVLNYSATQDILRRVNKAFKAFFRRVKNGEKPGYPRFKGRNRFNSIVFPAYGDGVKLRGRRLYVQNIGEIKVKLHRPVGGEIKTVTLKRNCGHWYAVFSCDIGDVPPLRSEVVNPVGIDVGIESFATLSDARVISNPRCFKRGEELLAKRQQRLSRRAKGSHRRRKAQTLVAKAHAGVKNQRKDFAHKLARELIKSYDLIAYEDLNIKGMVQNHCLAKAISDASWGQFIRILRYKAEEAGIVVIPVSPRNTSQRCSGCGEIVPKGLGERIHVCPYCGLILHRDLNASRNILALGLSAQGLTLRSRLLQVAE